jgi:hypothetical protein
MVFTGKNSPREVGWLGPGRKRECVGRTLGRIRMGSASAKLTTRQALCDSWDLWVGAAVVALGVSDRLSASHYADAGADTRHPFPDTTFVGEIAL